MSAKTTSNLMSLKLWGGLYLLTYGVMLEVAYFAARYATPFKWAFNLAIFCVAAAVGWKLAHWSKPAVKFAWPVVFVIGAGAVAFGLFYLPWVLPTYYGDIRFGWPEHVNRALQSVFKLALIIGGTCLVIAYARNRSSATEPTDAQSPTAGVPPKGVKESSAPQAGAK